MPKTKSRALKKVVPKKESCQKKNSRAEKKVVPKKTVVPKEEVVPEKTNVVKKKLDEKNYVALTGLLRHLPKHSFFNLFFFMYFMFIKELAFIIN